MDSSNNTSIDQRLNGEVESVKDKNVYRTQPHKLAKELSLAGSFKWTSEEALDDWAETVEEKAAGLDVNVDQYVAPLVRTMLPLELRMVVKDNPETEKDWEGLLKVIAKDLFPGEEDFKEVRTLLLAGSRKASVSGARTLTRKTLSRFERLRKRYNPDQPELTDIEKNRFLRACLPLSVLPAVASIATNLPYKDYDLAVAETALVAEEGMGSRLAVSAVGGGDTGNNQVKEENNRDELIMAINEMKESIAALVNVKQKTTEDINARWANKKCFACGEIGHPRSKCSRKNEHCGTCGLKGHTSAVCRNIAPRDSNVNAYITQTAGGNKMTINGMSEYEKMVARLAELERKIKKNTKNRKRTRAEAGL